MLCARFTPRIRTAHPSRADYFARAQYVGDCGYWLDANTPQLPCYVLVSLRAYARLTPSRAQYSPPSHLIFLYAKVMNKKLLIFDASNYIFRAFYASPPMCNSAGFPTNALHFYTSMLLSVIHRVNPDCIALAHEKKGPKFRHELYPEYKGQRTPPPEELVMQFPWFRKITDALGICAYDSDGFEADDVIATLTTQARNLQYDVIIASSDKDLMQLIASEDGYDRVVLLDALSKAAHAKNGAHWIGTNDVIARFNVEPNRVADVLALAGDAIDNIPGCKGIGEKTAGKLIAQYGSLENLMASRGEIKKPAQKANLDAFAPNAELSKKLVSLVYDVPVTLVEHTMSPNPDLIIPLFSALDLNKLLVEVLGKSAQPDPSVPKITPHSADFQPTIQNTSPSADANAVSNSVPNLNCTNAVANAVSNPNCANAVSNAVSNTNNAVSNPNCANAVANAVSNPNCTNTVSNAVSDPNCTNTVSNAILGSNDAVPSTPQKSPKKQAPPATTPDPEILGILQAAKRACSPFDLVSAPIVDSIADLDARFAAMADDKTTIAVVPIFEHTAPQAPGMIGCAFATGDGARDFYCTWNTVQKTLFDVISNDGNQCRHAIAQFLSRSDITFAVYDVKPILQWLWAGGYSPNIAQFFDIQIAAYILHPSRSRLSLQSCVAEFIARDLPILPDQWLGTGKKQKTPREMPMQSCADAALTWASAMRQCVQPLKSALERANLSQLFSQIDIPIAETLARMEFYGIEVETNYLREMATDFDEKLRKLDEEAHKFGDEPFNINSPKSLGHFLFETLKLEPATKKNKTHGLSTDQDTLESLDHPIASIILQYRTISKLRSSYTESLIDCADRASSRIHCHFNECVTATTRLSSSDPNLQNIPARSDLGRQIKRAFVPAKGYCFVSADYSQIELRVLASLSRDPVLVNAYQNDLDIHALTASELFDKKIDDVTKAERQIAKSINFGIVYGMGSQKLSREVHISKQEAKQFLEKFNQRFPVLAQWLDDNGIKARQTGVIHTVLGHRRIIDEFLSPNKMIQAAGDRIAANSPIQGSASDIVKCAMLRLQSLLAQNNSKARIILQIHDELLLETPIDELERTKAILIDAMTNACDIGIPLKIDLKVGNNWADM